MPRPTLAARGRVQTAPTVPIEIRAPEESRRPGPVRGRRPRLRRRRTSRTSSTAAGPIMDLSRFRMAVDGSTPAAHRRHRRVLRARDDRCRAAPRVPMGGVTWVSVAATHRRQGLLRRLLARDPRRHRRPRRAGGRAGCVRGWHLRPLRLRRGQPAAAGCPSTPGTGPAAAGGGAQARLGPLHGAGGGPRRTSPRSGSAPRRAAAGRDGARPGVVGHGLRRPGQGAPTGSRRCSASATTTATPRTG